ncbi:unnamed protein product [Alopecurus aequalis]
MALPEVVQIGLESYILFSIGGTVFYFVKGALRSSSKDNRLAGGVQEVTTNWPHVRRWGAWLGVLTAIDGTMRSIHAAGPLNFAVAWGGANALFSVQQGTDAVVRDGLKGVGYSVATGVTGAGLLLLIKSRQSSSQ